MALPRGFAEYLCLELDIVHQAWIRFKNPETSSLFGWWLFAAPMVILGKRARASGTFCLSLPGWRTW